MGKTRNAGGLSLLRRYCSFNWELEREGTCVLAALTQGGTSVMLESGKDGVDFTSGVTGLRDFLEWMFFHLLYALRTISSDFNSCFLIIFLSYDYFIGKSVCRVPHTAIPDVSSPLDFCSILITGPPICNIILLHPSSTQQPE